METLWPSLRPMHVAGSWHRPAVSGDARFRQAVPWAGQRRAPGAASLQVSVWPWGEDAHGVRPWVRTVGHPGRCLVQREGSGRKPSTHGIPDPAQGPETSFVSFHFASTGPRDRPSPLLQQSRFVGYPQSSRRQRARPLEGLYSQRSRSPRVPPFPPCVPITRAASGRIW